jgi:hypothetical protein
MASDLSPDGNGAAGPPAAHRPVRRFSPASRVGDLHGVFVFFSNRLGCGGSLLLSAVVTAILLLVTGVIRLN